MPPRKGRLTSELLMDVMRRLADATAPDATLAPEQRVRSAVDAYLRFAEANADAYRAVYKSELSGEPELRALVEATLDQSAERIFAILAADVRARQLVRVAVHGWFRFLIDVCLRWLDERAVEREAVLELSLDTLFSAVAAATRAAAHDGEW
jgi:hypothetical protein